MVIIRITCNLETMEITQVIIQISFSSSSLEVVKMKWMRFLPFSFLLSLLPTLSPFSFLLPFLSLPASLLSFPPPFFLFFFLISFFFFIFFPSLSLFFLSSYLPLSLSLPLSLPPSLLSLLLSFLTRVIVVVEREELKYIYIINFFSVFRSSFDMSKIFL